jgi:hypothetical protein
MEISLYNSSMVLLTFYGVILTLLTLSITFFSLRYIKKNTDALLETNKNQERATKFDAYYRIQKDIEDIWKEYNEKTIIDTFKTTMAGSVVSPAGEEIPKEELKKQSMDIFNSLSELDSSKLRNEIEKIGILERLKADGLQICYPNFDQELDKLCKNIKLLDDTKITKVDILNLLRSMDTLGVLIKHGTVPVDFMFDFYSRRIIVVWYYLYYLRTKLRDEGKIFIGTKFEVLARFAYNYRINTSKRDPGGTPSFIDREPFLLDPNTLPRTDMQADRCDWTKTMWFEDPSYKEKICNFGELNKEEKQRINSESKAEAQKIINERTKYNEMEFLKSRQKEYYGDNFWSKYKEIISK